MDAFKFENLSAEQIPTRHEFDFPYALGVLSRQSNGTVATWIGCSTPNVLEQSFKWMSVTKFLVAVSFWIQSLPKMGVDALSLDSPVGTPVSAEVSLRDLLAHCAGLPFDAPIADTTAVNETIQMGVALGIAQPHERVICPFTKRVYSNYGFEIAGQIVQKRLGETWINWVHRVLLTPLGMGDTKLAGSPAWGATGPVLDLAKLAAEILSPRKTGLSAEDIERFTLPVHPGLRGILPGYGHQRDNLWGIGVELHGSKSPHYLPESFPPEVFGHFGQSGTFIWIDQMSGVAGVFLGERNFGAPHKTFWPRLNAEIHELAVEVQS